MPKQTILLLGATGLVGGCVLDLLLTADFCRRVVTLSRRPPAPRPVPGGKLDARIVDFERPDTWLEAIDADQVICTLGTTIKAAGSRAAFRRVDFDYPLMAAMAARASGCRHFLLVSAMGADPQSRFFYNRIKGELEAAIRGLGFEGVSIFRPSLLLGRRRAFRPGEAAAQVLGRWFAWTLPRRYRPIHARLVAAALVRTADQDPSGCRVFASDAIAELGAD